ncbi:MAG TPA: tetratricopeptide repeat protein [Polyangiaceae bacterium]
MTLLGPPGMGKTRLALRYGESEAARRHAGGVWFVDLSAARTLEDLCVIVSAQIGVGFAQAGDMVIRIAHALTARGDLLLILDNFEQLVADGANAVATWLALAPKAHVLVTSRELLRVLGEMPYELGPMPLPRLDGFEVSAALATCSMKLLFARSPTLIPSEENARVLAEILTALEGIPLAIELCAARLGTLGPTAVLSRMPDRLNLLSRGARDVDARQRTLRGAIDWSWDLLNDSEQLALGSCSVFVQGFDVSALEYVCAEVLSGTTMDLLQSLREKSLMRALGEGANAGEARFGLYDSIRVYAAEKVQRATLAHRLSLRHARYFAEHGYAEVLNLHLQHGNESLRWLTLESENIRQAYAALGTFAEHARWRVQLVLAAEPVLGVRGPFDRFRQMLDEVIARDLGANLEPALVSRVYRARARILRQRGAMDESVLDLEQALACASVAADASLSAELLVDRGEIEQERGQFARAGDRYHDALAVLGEMPDNHARARANAGLGLLCQSQGRLSEALELFSLALDQALRSGDRRIVAGLCKDIGSLRLQQGRLVEAHEHYARAADLLAELDDPILAGIVEGNLAILAQEQGRFQDALGHFQNAERKLSRSGARLLEAHVRGYKGALHHELAELDRASSEYSAALAVLREVGDRRLEGLFLAALGGAAAARGRTLAAREAFASSEKLLSEVGDPGLLEALELHRGVLSIALSEEARAREDSALSNRERGHAVALARQTRERLEAGKLAHSDDARFALRLLERALQAQAWVFDPTRGELRAPSGELIDLAARPQLLRILIALAEQRVKAPGAPLAVEELIEQGWPGERMQPLAAQNRMKVALSTLRSLGLRELLMRNDDGYLLDPLVPLWIGAQSAQMN